ncbi:hypothetical protein GCM10010411_60570 [Actinomadura fulvescens]|uniref:Uncharacterized protein n=1 Tax=Actinomadura fulvescens TaxID=46160 RepID=A0ABN3Q585_9ACTN
MPGSMPGSGGAASLIAPYPIRFTRRSPPSSNVPMSLPSNLNHHGHRVEPRPRGVHSGLLKDVRQARQALRSRSGGAPTPRPARAETTMAQLRLSIEQLERRLARAQEKEIRDAEEAMAARRAWLQEAERTLAEGR